MQRAVVVDAVRTPTGKRNGRLQGYHPVDLAAIPLRALVERNQLDPALVDDVIMGCVTQTGEQSFNVGRNAALAAVPLAGGCSDCVDDNCPLHALSPSYADDPRSPRPGDRWR